MWTVSRDESGLRLVQYLKEKLDGVYSSRTLKRAIESNFCQVNGFTEKFASRRLQKGDSVIFDTKEMNRLNLTAFSFEKLRVLYEDSSFLIYDKPSGISCDEQGVLSIFPDFHLVHRLDKGTTGVLIFAKSASVKEAMIRQFQQLTVKKEYKALVVGAPQTSKGVIENQLGKLREFEGQTVWGSVKNGKRAKTAWILEKRGKEISLLTCYPETGRTHQIRVHLSEMDLPVLGDFQYGREKHHPFFPKRMFLHAYSIAFDHPITDSRHLITAKLPEDFKELTEKAFQ